MRYSGKLIFLILIIATFCSFGKNISQQTARKIASDITARLAVFDNKRLSISKTFPVTEKEKDLFYICNVGNDDGFVIISAQDNARTLLGYSSNGNYDPQNVPPNFKAWLDEYKNQLLQNKSKNRHPAQHTKKLRERHYHEDISKIGRKPVVAPLLKGIHWDQGSNWFRSSGPDWNSMCPQDKRSTTGNAHVWAGCVATATAMIMKYHSYPERGRGTHSYYHFTYGTQRVDFGATTYDWSNMPASKNQVTMDIARLLYQVGVAVNMNYGINSSRAYSGYAVDGLIDYFNYSPQAKFVIRLYYSDAEWKNMLKEQLDNGRAILYRGADSSGTRAHAFVCDGYDDADYFHFNWGWSGTCNGYYTLDGLVPGTTPYSYNYGHAAGFDIKIPGYNDYAINNIHNSFSHFVQPHQFGQSFTTKHAGLLEEIRLRLKKSINTTLRIYKGEYILPANEIYHQPIQFDVPANEFAVIHFEINDPVELKANTVYTFVLDQAELVFEQNTYDGGRLFYDGNFYRDSDLHFYLCFDGIVPAPENLTQQKVTRNSAELDWEENSAATLWNIEYGPSGFSKGDGTKVQTTSRPYSLDDLKDNQSFDFYVQSVCENEKSDWSSAGSFSVLTTPPGHNVIFDGRNDYIDVGNVGNVQTIEFWVRLSTLTEGLVILNNAKSVKVRDGRVDLVGETNESVYVNGQAGGTLQIGTWSHVAIVSPSSFDVNSLTIGFDDNDYLSGSIDEFRLWSVALDETDIRKNLHRTLLGTEENLVAYYPCDDAKGIELTDKSRGRCQGALMNTTGDEWGTSVIPAGDDSDWISSGSKSLSNMTVTYKPGSSGSLGLFTTGTGNDWLRTDDGKLLDKYWGVEEYGSVTATLHFDLSDISLPSDKDWPDIRLLKRDNKASPWQDITGLCSHTPTTSEPYFEITRSEFSEFRPATETPIGVNLAFFDAILENGSVRLNWLTETETNLAGFYISRRSEDEQFERIHDKLISAQRREGENYVYTDHPPHRGHWYYRLEEIDLSGHVVHHAPVKVAFASDVASQKKLPQDFCLYPNHPNPFNPATKFSFDIPRQAHVKISVYDALGRHVQTLVDGVRQAGHHKARWDATDRHGHSVASGVYFLVMTAGNHRFKDKMMLLH